MNHKLVKDVLFTAIICVALVMSGCAAHKTDIVDAKFSGFLENYALLKPGSDDQALFVYKKPGVDFKSYNKIMIDPVFIYYSQEAEFKGIEPGELKELTDSFLAELKNALAGYQIVTKPEPGTLRLRIAITEIVPAKPVAGTLSSLVPIGMAISAASKVATGEHTSIGETAIEMDVRDAMTVERLAAAVDRRAGKKRPFRGKFEDAHDAFVYWSSLIRERIDEARGVSN